MPSGQVLVLRLFTSLLVRCCRLGSTLYSKVSLLRLAALAALVVTCPLLAQERVFVLDTKGKRLVMVGLESGHIEAAATFDGSPSMLMHVDNGRSILALDPGPHKATRFGMQPKGPMIATLLDAKTLAATATITIGHGSPNLDLMSLSHTQPLAVQSIDAQRISIVCAGYRSKKPEETLSREIVTIDAPTASIIGRVPVERTPTSAWRISGRDEGVFFVPGKGEKTPEPAEILFFDLKEPKILERLLIDGSINQAFLTSDSKWLYLLDPGVPSPKLGKNVDGRLHIISVAERKLAASLDVGSRPRGFFNDEARGQVLLISDGAPVVKGQTRLGEVRILRGSGIRATVQVPPGPHLVRLRGEQAFIVCENAVATVALTSAQHLRDIPVKEARLMDELTFSADGRRAFGLFAGLSRLAILDVERGDLMGSITTGRGGVKFAKNFGVALLSAALTVASYDISMSAARSQGNSYFMYNVYNLGVASPETFVVVRPDGAIAYAINSQTNDVTIVDVEKAIHISKEPAQAQGALLLPNGKRVAVLGKNELRLIDTSTNRLEPPLRFEDSQRVNLAFTRDERTALAWGGKDLYLLDAGNGSVRSKVVDLLGVTTVLFEWDAQQQSSPAIQSFESPDTVVASSAIELKGLGPKAEDVPIVSSSVLVPSQPLVEGSSRSTATASLEVSTIPAGKEAGERWSDPHSNLEFVWIPAGNFLMGADGGNVEERPRHPVTISRGYWMGRYEVTQKQFESVMQTRPSKFTHAGPNAPADSVTWLEAKEFVKRLNQKAGSNAYALPTEAQWEYACRAGTSSFNENLLAVLGWHHANSDQSTQPVGKLRPNAWGLYDMLGNVWEWCEDWYAGKHDASKASDPTGPATGNLRVARGGAWDSHDKKPDLSAFTFRSAIASPNYGVKIISPTVRYAQSPEMRSDNVGFRIVVIP